MTALLTFWISILAAAIVTAILLSLRNGWPMWIWDGSKSRWYARRQTRTLQRESARFWIIPPPPAPQRSVGQRYRHAHVECTAVRHGWLCELYPASALPAVIWTKHRYTEWGARRCADRMLGKHGRSNRLYIPAR